MRGQIKRGGKTGGWMLRAGGRRGRHKSLLGYHSLSICWLQTRCSVCVAVRRGLTSLCTPPVSQHTLIGSDLGMTHHMPTPHAPSDLHLPLSSFPSVPPFMHLCSSPTNTPTPTHPLSRCSFVPLHSHVSSGLHIFTRFASCCLYP